MKSMTLFAVLGVLPMTVVGADDVPLARMVPIPAGTFTRGVEGEGDNLLSCG